MSSAGLGQGSKKETVYDGPAPAAKQGTVYSGPTIPTTPPPTTGTVYGGPSLGSTVYSGPIGGGTAYNGSAVARPGVGGAVSSAVNPGATRGARIFYLIAGFTVLRTILIYAGVQALTAGAPSMDDTALKMLLVVNLLIAGVFALLGVFTHRGSKIAFLIGMVLYAGDLVLLFANNPASHVVSIVLHGLILFYLYKAFTQLQD